MSVKTIAVVDYGMGNLRSVAQAVRTAAQGAANDWQVHVTHQPETVRAAQRIILPGQGAMPECMRALHQSGLLQAVHEAAQNKPLFGICVGMQMLLEHSAEGDVACLGLMAGQVQAFDFAHPLQDESRLKVPHMGWNRVRQTPHPLWQGIADDSWYYFVHSFYACPHAAQHIAGHSQYGHPFAAAIARDNLFATQFHPEKSAAAGLALLRNFLHWNP